MSTTECGTDIKLVKASGLQSGGSTTLVRIKSVWRAICNRIASNSLAEFDDYQLDDIGLTRGDVIIALDRSGVLDDPSLLLSQAARERARTRFSRPARR